MSKMGNLLKKGLLLLFILCALAYPAFAKEAQGGTDGSITILTIVVASLGIAVTVLAIIIGLCGYGFFQTVKLREAKEVINNKVAEMKKTINQVKEKAEVFKNDLENKSEEIEKAVKDIEAIRNEVAKETENGVETYIEALRNKEEPPEGEEPTEEIKEKPDELNELSRKLEFLELLERGSLNPEAHRIRGVSHYNKKEFNEALKAYNKAIKLKPKFAEAWVGKGLALGKLGRFKEKLEAYDTAIDSNTKYARGWYNRACVYSTKGEKERALSDLKRAIEINSSYRKRAKVDPDFENLKNDTDFINLTK